MSGYSAVNAPTARCSPLPAFETVQRVLTSTISKYSTPLLNQERVHALLLYNGVFMSPSGGLAIPVANWSVR